MFVAPASMTFTRGPERFQDSKPVNEPTQDPSPRARLSPDTVARLRIALQHWVRDEGASDDALRDALHAIAAEARQHGIRAEEVLVTLKRTWFEIGGAPNAPRSATSSDHKRLDELVTACIKAYYG
jgi:hypothetical protein